MNTKFLQKISELKKETGKMSKDSTNPFFKSKYFDVNQLLEHLEPIAEAKGLLILQPIVNGEVYSQIIDIESGDKIESSIQLTQFNDPQKTGSAITYYRRYSLQSLLGLQAEDDDANKASGNAENKPKETKSNGLPWLNENDNNWKLLQEAINSGNKPTLKFIKGKYNLSKATEEKLKSNFNIV